MKERECADVLAFPAQVGAKGDFGRRAEKAPFSLVVDLHAEEIGLKWIRGAATLAALCSAAIFLTPDWHPEVETPTKPPQGTLKYAQLSELAAPQPAILEDAETDELVRHPAGLTLGIPLRDAQEDHQPRPDPADDLALDGDTGLADTLEDGFHELKGTAKTPRAPGQGICGRRLRR